MPRRIANTKGASFCKALADRPNRLRCFSGRVVGRFRLTLAEDLRSEAIDRIREAKLALEGICNGSSHYEGEYFVYGVPPKAETAEIEDLLDKGEGDGLWSWELSTGDEARA